MSISNMSIEQSRIQNIAEDYKKRGYSVTIAPSVNRLPSFLRKFRPDIIAEGPNESIVIETKSSAKVRGTDYWKRLSSVVEQHPGWRVELIINGDPSEKVRETLTPERIKERISEGQQLSEKGMLAAALLVTWSAAEAAMRLKAKNYSVELPDLRPSTLISRLYSDGLLAKDQYDFLIDCMRIRNSVAHGFFESRLRIGMVKQLQQLALHFLE